MNGRAVLINCENRDVESTDLADLGLNDTERNDSKCTATHLHSQGARFESRPGH
jgi:hypothetical protein